MNSIDGNPDYMKIFDVQIFDDFILQIIAIMYYPNCTICMRGSRKFVRGGPLLTTFFFFFFFQLDEGRKDPNTTISGPLTARQQNAI